MILMLGIVNDLLSSKICVFLAKISYSGYLVHFNVIVHYVSQLRIPFYYTLNQFAVINVGIIVITLVISTFLTITIEIPFRNLGKCILPETLLSSRKSQTGVIINGYSNKIILTYQRL